MAQWPGDPLSSAGTRMGRRSCGAECISIVAQRCAQTRRPQKHHRRKARRAFLRLGWKEKGFKTKIVVDDAVYDTPTHKVDCYKNRVALEVEWNNKDPFYDRDLNNFRLLSELRAIDLGIIVTRCDELRAIFDKLKRGKSYGSSTTHIAKLLPRIEGGGGGGCPIVVFGIRGATYVED